MMKRIGCRFSRISTASSSASSSSHGEALRVLARLPRDHLHVAGAQPLRGPAAVHRGVADADDQHAAANRLDVAEVDRLEPVDADEDLVGIAAPGDVQLLAPRRAGPDEHGVVTPVIHQPLQAVDRGAVPDIHAHVGDVTDLLVEHVLRETERRDVDPHEAAGARQLLEDGDLVAERHQVVRHGQRCWTGANQRHLLSVLLLWRGGNEVLHFATVIGRNALQPADRDGLPIDAGATTGRLARPIAGPAENARKDVGFPINEVGVGEASLGDQAMYSGTLVCAGQAHWQSTTRWK